MDEHHNNKIRPFTCYFCNKLVDNDTEYGHVSNCGSVLEPCINKCGSYVPRNMKNRHLKECQNTKTKSHSKLSLEDENYRPQQLVNWSLGRPRSRINSTNSSDLTQLSFKYQNLDQVCKNLSQNLFHLKNKYQEGVATQQHLQMQTQLQLEKIHYFNEILQGWKHATKMQIECLKQEIQHFCQTQNQFEVKMIHLEKIQIDVQKNRELVKKEFHAEQSAEQSANADAIRHLQTQLHELKEYVDKKNTIFESFLKDQKIETDKLIDNTCDIAAALNESKTKNCSLIFDLRTVSQISAEALDKLEIQERVITDLKQELAQFKLDLTNLEEFSANELGRQMTGEAGRMLWKISDFSLKMKNAKENDTVLKSPLFYTHNYGYKVKLQIYLNGIKKWKGRHMIACLHVLKGEYDLLLKWPCHIEGTMTLRDLYNYTNPIDFSKYISAKRHFGDEDNEEPQESSTQYIFVPHTTLSKQHFIKEDTMFIEIRINSINKLRDETEL